MLIGASMTDLLTSLTLPAR